MNAITTVIVGAITGFLMSALLVVFFGGNKLENEKIKKRTPSGSDLIIFLANNLLLMFFSGLILMLDFSSENELHFNSITVVALAIFTMELLAPILYFSKLIDIKKYTILSISPWVIFIVFILVVALYNTFL